jgi:hypothetical protein
MEQTQIRLVHWYDIEAHRIACGAPGQSGSTKHVGGVTCSACRTLLAKSDAESSAASDPVSYIH